MREERGDTTAQDQREIIDERRERINQTGDRSQDTGDWREETRDGRQVTEERGNAKGERRHERGNEREETAFIFYNLPQAHFFLVQIHNNCHRNIPINMIFSLLSASTASINPYSLQPNCHLTLISTSFLVITLHLLVLLSLA
jgi:hypothetical protein